MEGKKSLKRNKKELNMDKNLLVGWHAWEKLVSSWKLSIPQMEDSHQPKDGFFARSLPISESDHRTVINHHEKIIACTFKNRQTSISWHFVMW